MSQISLKIFDKSIFSCKIRFLKSVRIFYFFEDYFFRDGPSKTET